MRKPSLMHTIPLLAAIIMAAAMWCVPAAAQRNGEIVYGGVADYGSAEYNKELQKQLYTHSQPLGIRYTAKHPLIVAADWDFKPYAFINDHGEPDGFQVEIFRSILDRIHIPYEIRMMDWRKARREVESGRVHVMIDYRSEGKPSTLRYGRSVVYGYLMAILHLKTTENLRNLVFMTGEDTLYFRRGDYGDHFLKDNFKEGTPFVAEYADPPKAIEQILKGEMKYFLWGRSALRDLVRRYNLGDRLVVEPIDIAPGGKRFASTDTVLLYELDIQLQRLKDMGQYDAILNKWLSETPQHEEASANMKILAVVAIFFVVIVIVIIILLIQRSASAANLKEEFRKISRMAINLTDCQVIAISTRTTKVYNVFGDFVPKESIAYHEYEAMIHPDDITVEYEARRQVDDGETHMPVLQMRMRPYGDTSDNWRLMNVHAFIKADKAGKPVYVYLVFVDETERMMEERQLDGSLKEFASITEISDVAMLYYDRSGRCDNCNRSAVRLFDKGGTGRGEAFLRGTTMTEMSMLFNGLSIENQQQLWVCAPLNVPEMKIHTTVELRMQHVYDERGIHKGYVVAMTDLEDDIRVTRNISAAARRIGVISEELARYQRELRFILRKNKMTTFRWRVGNDYMETSQDLLSFDVKVPFSEYLSLLPEECHAETAARVAHPEEYFSKPLQLTRMIYREKNGEVKPYWYAINVIPEYDESNRFSGAFGMSADITDYMMQQECLKQETAKAEDGGRQKALFLANMTHELRTPLNAINGFAEVMLMQATDEEKKEYISIMARNCGMLISLIDNILQLSMMDTDGIRLDAQRVDIAPMFREEMQKMDHYFHEKDVEYHVDKGADSLVLTVDMPRLMQVMDAFVSNAAKFTDHGSVHVGYRYHDGILTMYCRDTGPGIPAEEHQHIFERFVKLNNFVQGTGLGLSVCKMIAEKMGATITIYSKEGEGTTISINLKV